MKLQHLRIRCLFQKMVSGSDSDATVDYRDQQSSLLSLVEGEEDNPCLKFPSDFRVFPLLFPWTGISLLLG